MSAPTGTAPATAERRYPVGAEPIQEAGIHFRVWAPDRERVELIVEARLGNAESEPESHDMQSCPGGYFSHWLPEARPGLLYRYRLDGDGPFPDPASRFQPSGPHGPSEVVDPSAFRWTDGDWPGLEPEGQVLYEAHIGTLTPDGSWESAARLLPDLVDLGITAVLILPVAEFHGRFGWGYDGVDLFAPSHLYGRPDDFRAFVDHAHSLGLGVLLDVVYNHVGSEGAYLQEFTDCYFSEIYRTAWGRAFNFDEAESRPVREFFLSNVAYWIEEFHVDGYRVDAANHIHDASPEHILTELARRARRAARERRVFLMAENESQDAYIVRSPERGGHGFDATWNEDFHHAARVALTGRREAYLTDYRGEPQEFISLARRGFLYQGQPYRWQNKRRGTPALDLPPRTFVNYLQNHDQVANTPGGERIHQLAGPATLRAVTALFLLGPATPLLFQGQEYGAEEPFLYFADVSPELIEPTRSGRAEHLAQFRSLAGSRVSERMPDPSDRTSFARCKLDPGGRNGDGGLYALHRDLIRMRREDPTLRAAGRRPPEGAVLGSAAFLLRYFGEEGDDRLLLVNLGAELTLTVAPEPLLAPPEQRRWRILWTSEDPAYGGWGSPPPETDEGWRLPGRAALLLRADPEG